MSSQQTKSAGDEQPVPQYSLNLSTMNENVRDMVYAVRGAVPIAAGKIAAELTKPKHGYPFTEILYCNIGNPQSVGQQAVTFYRQCLALINCPFLLEQEGIEKQFPADVIARAKAMLTSFGSGTGAYSHSQGHLSIRKQVADYIEGRDGHPCNPEELFLTNGASSGIGLLMNTMLASPKDALLIPLPQYPIYTALLAQLGAQAVFYTMDENNGWTCSEQELERALAEGASKGLNVRGMAIINPGNPTGQCMDPDTLGNIAKFCEKNQLVLMADEVYQANVYSDTKKFTSMKKIVRDLGLTGLQLASYHSTSKGVIGECGRRGGYMELCGFDPEIFAMIYKLASSTLCSSTDGQVMTGLMVTPPQPGEESYALFTEQTQGIFDSLKRKSRAIVAGLNSIPGITCNEAEGAMYVFPKVDMPQAAIDAAADQGVAADLMYCLSLLEATGICCVPGSGFGQVSGTYHFRATFLPPEEKMPAIVAGFRQHHEQFMAKYGVKSKL